MTGIRFKWLAVAGAIALPGIVCAQQASPPARDKDRGEHLERKGERQEKTGDKL